MKDNQQTLTYVGHGVWIPGEDAQFDNHGLFAFWVETPLSKTKLAKKTSGQHSAHLAEHDELTDFLKSNLFFGQDIIDQLDPEAISLHVTLPSVENMPLPSAEMAQIQRFAPQLKCAIHHGSDRITQTDELKKLRKEHNVVITSFNLVRSDSALFKLKHGTESW